MNFKEIIRAFFSGILLVASFAPWEPVAARKDLAIIAWMAWIPLLSCLIPIDPEKRCRQPFSAGFLMGLVFWVGTIFWLAHVTWIGMAALAVYLSLYPAVWAWGWRGWASDGRRPRVPFIFCWHWQAHRRG